MGISPSLSRIKAQSLILTGYPWVDPKAFGATCDGVTADDAAVIAAISRAENDGVPVVRVPRLIYTENAFAIPSWMTFGNPTDIEAGANIIPNANFHTWQRVEVRQLSPAQFSYSAPTFGDSGTYEGTSGVAVFCADMWYVRHFGYNGSGVISRVALTADELTYNNQSQFKLNWVGNSAAVATAVVTTITGATSPTLATVTITAPAHGLSNGDYTYIKDSIYTGGNGTIDGTYQVSNVSGSNFDITVTPDAGFSGWTAYGKSTNDPYFETYEHLYDPAVSLWVRNGTAGHQLSCRIPTVRRPGGYYTFRIRARVNSGNAEFYPRMYYDYGSGGTPTPTYSLTFPKITLTAEFQDFVAIRYLPDISGNTFGTSIDTAYLQIGLDSANPEVSHDIDIMSVSLRPGIAAVAGDSKNREDEWSYLREFYQGVRVGVLQNVTTGQYYGVSHSFDPPMRGTPTVMHVRDIVLTNFASPTVSNNRTKEGFTAVAQANTTAQAHWSSIFEAEHKIPT